VTFSILELENMGSESMNNSLVNWGWGCCKRDEYKEKHWVKIQLLGKFKESSFYFFYFFKVQRINL